jgi:hypothetical protein
MITPNYDRPLRTLTADKDLVFEFFFVFSRFEYALKRAKYVTGEDGKVKADWDKFAKCIKTLFNSGATPEIAKAVSYLRTNPPMKQNHHNKVLGWTPVTRSENGVRWLLRLTQTVRNNLFHGGKFSDGPFNDPARDTQLLSYCLILLNECLKLDPIVESYFVGRRG